VHRAANVLNKLHSSLHAKAKRALQQIWMAETKKDALAALDMFVDTYGTKYEKAVDYLKQDRDVLLAFYDFPAEHRKHLRTTNPIARSRPCATARSDRWAAARTRPRSPWSSSWPKPHRKAGGAARGHNQLPKVNQGVKFTDGIEVVRPHGKPLPPDPF
jgi:hypothetical protein